MDNTRGTESNKSDFHQFKHQIVKGIDNIGLELIFVNNVFFRAIAFHMESTLRR
jgi:hypothetical protein